MKIKTLLTGNLLYKPILLEVRTNKSSAFPHKLACTLLFIKN